MAQNRSLYEVLGLDSNASQGEIKKAYHKLALQLHPDKNPGDEAANVKFQQLQKIYGILSDPDKRKMYDATGSTDDDLLSAKVEDLYEYFRAMFKKVTEEDIVAISNQYRGSEEETQDVLAAYSRFKGDMDMLFSVVMCSEPDLDSHRFLDTIEDAVAQGKVKTYKVFKRWAQKVKSRPQPVEPLKPKVASKHAANRANNKQALVAAIQSKRAKSAESFLSGLAEKYGAGKARGSSKERKRKNGDIADKEASREEAGAAHMMPDIPDDEFAALQERLFKQCPGTASTSKTADNDKGKGKRRKQAGQQRCNEAAVHDDGGDGNDDCNVEGSAVDDLRDQDANGVIGSAADGSKEGKKRKKKNNNKAQKP